MALIDALFEKTTPGLEKALDLAWQRGQAIASNVANAETPKYRAVDLDFQAELNRAFNTSSTEVTKTNSLHMDTGNGDAGARLVKDLSGATKADGNNVDIDVQMLKMQRNQSDFTEAANILRKQFRVLSQAIRNAQ
jgi:flagellar basal-body rod protein FlgB